MPGEDGARLLATGQRFRHAIELHRNEQRADAGTCPPKLIPRGLEQTARLFQRVPCFLKMAQEFQGVTASHHPQRELVRVAMGLPDARDHIGARQGAVWID